MDRGVLSSILAHRQALAGQPPSWWLPGGNGSSAASAQLQRHIRSRAHAYASQRHRTAGVITQNTNTAPEPKLVAEQVLRSIEGPYPHATAHGQAALLSWLRRLLPARMFEPSLRKAFALDSASKGGGATEPRS